MLLKGILGSQMSGAVGGIVASRNRSGPYFRARAIPSNPNTEFQQEVRSAMSQLSARWSGVLTPDERSAWDAYSLNVPLTNRVGDPVNVGGLGMYQRCNIPLIQTGQAGGVIIDTAPTIYNLGEYTAPSIDSALAVSNALSINFENTDAWANETGSDMLIFVSRPKNPSVNYFKGPYRYASAIEGDDTTAPSSPAVIDSPFPFEVGQKIFIRVAVLRLDGRYSADFRASVVAE